MTVTAASMKSMFPEFTDTDDDLIEAKVAMASERIDSLIFDTETDSATSYLAAHLIAISPFGQAARLSQDNDQTVYFKEYERIKRTKAVGYRLASTVRISGVG